jgi:hypothetical protein
MISAIEMSASALFVFQEIDRSKVKIADALSNLNFNKASTIAREERVSLSNSPITLRLPPTHLWSLTPSMCWSPV